VRVNRAIELLAQDQPIYYVRPKGRGYEGGRQAADTWADFIAYDTEHEPFDPTELHAFMRGLAEAGPTRSGHRTPAVVAALPISGDSEQTVRVNAWMINQILATGVHGLLLNHAEDPAAVRAFVECSRYPFAQTPAGLGVGRRGAGGQGLAAPIWGVEWHQYLNLADVWPLNPSGELLLGVKIENARALERCEESLAQPGLGFAEWGPGDMALSLGFPGTIGPPDPYPEPMQRARERAFSAARANNLAWVELVLADEVEGMIERGVRIFASGRGGRAVADRGRRFTKRTMPW
jgi:4-hydroxy-2-oxoheptanedioate aldolase